MWSMLFCVLLGWCRCLVVSVALVFIVDIVVVVVQDMSCFVFFFLSASLRG